MGDLAFAILLAIAVGGISHTLTTQDEQDRVLRACSLHHTVKLAEGVAINCTVIEAP